jgi:TM2 domain-containing membrane protein YozV
MLVSDYSEKPWQWKYAEPSEAPEPFWIEVHDNIYWRKLVWENPNVPYYACAVYLGIIFGLKRLMRDRAPVKAQAILVSWNLFLAIFSFMGFFRVSQELTGIWKEPNGFHKSLCVREGRGMATDYWGLLFLLSKFIELGKQAELLNRSK